jgi:hypothetical protein
MSTGVRSAEPTVDVRRPIEHMRATVSELVRVERVRRDSSRVTGLPRELRERRDVTRGVP